MKILRYICLVAVIATLSSCFEDKGNYDYEDIEEPKIDLDWTYYAEIGAPLNITPNEIPENADDYKYEWYVKGTKIGEGCPLVIDNYQGIVSSWVSYLVMTNKKTGIRHFYKFMLSTSTKMQSGWMVLGEKDGKTRLDFVQVKVVDNVSQFNLIPDVISDLPAGPKKLQEHWAGRNDLGQVAIICDNNQAAEYDGNLKKVIDIEREFLDNTYPAGFELDAIHYLIYNSLAFSVDGNMYTRYNNIKETYQAGSYVHTPLYPEKGMEVGFTVYSRPRNSYQALIYDSKNNRFLVVLDENDSSAGRLLPLGPYHDSQGQDRDNIFDLTNLGVGNKVLACGAYKASYYTGNYFAVIRGTDGKTYTQPFSIYVKGGKTAKFQSVVIRSEVVNGNLLGDDTKFMICYDNTERMFFATGDKLYYMTRTTNELKLFEDFKGVNVASIKYDIAEVSRTLANNQMGVALSDGTFRVYDITSDGITSALEGEPNVLFEYKQIDRIADISYKVGTRAILDN